MESVRSSHLAHLIINIISFCLILFACVLIFIQTIINIKYNYSNNKNIIAEKLVYQQFSHDIYSNINNKILYQFEMIPYYNDCPEGKEVLNFPIKIDSYYDCENIFTNELNKDICQNKISRSSICCKNDCCENDIYMKQTICREKNINDINEDDKRKDDCTYFNIYNGKFSKLNGSIVCLKRYDYNYEYLLFYKNNKNCQGEKCIYFDSKNHCICDDENLNNQSNIFLNRSIIVKNIFSEIEPYYLEYESILKESLLNNKIKITKKEKEEVELFKTINKKNINEVFFKDKIDIKNGVNENYVKQKDYLLDDLINNNQDYIFQKYKYLNNDYIRKKNIHWFTRNYIGFKDYEELQKFKSIFDENDPMNNPLYKIGINLIYPNWESIIIIVLIFITLIFACFTQIQNFINEKNIKTNIIFICNSLRQISTMILLIIYLFLFLFKYIYFYKMIEIDMEIYYQFILEKYNTRRKQKYLLSGVIILCVNFLIELINYLIMIIINKRNGLNPDSKYTIIYILKNSCDNKEYPFKFYLNRDFSEEMKRFKKKFFDNYDIEECEIENENKTTEKIRSSIKIKDLRLQKNSIILVKCEQK